MNFIKILKLYEQLEEYLKKYGDNTIVHSYIIVRKTILYLKAENTNKEKENYIIQSYKSLYPGKGALSEFYIWDNDPEKRKRLNEPLDNLHNELWEIVKDYI